MLFTTGLRGASLTLVISVATAAVASAQAADTSSVAYAVFNETFRAVTPRYVVLAQSRAYRVEIIPEDPFDVIDVPALTISVRGQPREPVRVFADNWQTVRGGVSFIVIPGASAEYRLEVTGTRETVTVRIDTEPNQQALLDGRLHPIHIPLLGFRCAGPRP